MRMATMQRDYRRPARQVRPGRPFLRETNPIFVVFEPKTAIDRKNEPKQTQLGPLGWYDAFCWTLFMQNKANHRLLGAANADLA